MATKTQDKAAPLVRGLACLRCGHEWYPRHPKAPKVCPQCKRTDWQTEKAS